jgi:hypothetical protein
MRPIAVIPIILCVLLLIMPVTARDIEVTGGNIDIKNTLTGDNIVSYNYNANPDERIAIIEFDIPLNTRVDFTLTYGTGVTVDGWMMYTPAAVFGWSFSNVSLGGDTRGEQFVDAQVLGYSLTKHVQFQSYGVNKSASPPMPGFALYAQGYGLFSDEIVFYPVENIESNLITGFSMRSNQPIQLTLITNDADKLSTFVRKSVREYQANVIGDVSNTARDWINFGISIISYVYEIAVSLFYWFKFFFVDNLGMTVALYVSVTMVFAARASKGNMAKFLRTWFKDQIGLFRFILELVHSLVNLIGTVRGWFRL